MMTRLTAHTGREPHRLIRLELETLKLLRCSRVSVVMASLVAQDKIVQLVGATVRQPAAVMDVQRFAIEQVGPTYQAQPSLAVRHDPVRRRTCSVTKSPPAVACRPVWAEAR